jgi:hypothetical protein
LHASNGTGTGFEITLRRYRTIILAIEAIRKSIECKGAKKGAESDHSLLSCAGGLKKNEKSLSWLAGIEL